MKSETLIAAIVIAGLAMAATSGDNPSAAVSSDDSTDADRAKLTAILKKKGVTEPEGGFSIPDTLLGLRDMAVETRATFKRNEEALTLLVTAVAGPEASLFLQMGDEVLNFLLGGE